MGSATNMPDLPEVIRDEEQLDEVMTRPWPSVVDFLRDIDGDILVLGAGGKIGPTLVRMLSRAVAASGARRDVIPVVRRPPDTPVPGVRSITCDLMVPEAVAALPRAPNVFFLAGRKFGSTGNEPLTWATNVIVPYHVARIFTESRIVAFSTGGVYPIMDVETGGATEQTPPEPLGEYSMSCLGRERMFDYFSQTAGERVVHIRLNYAVEMRYGVLVDIATKVWRGEPLDVTTGWANVIWQGDVANYAILALQMATSPAQPLNITGPGMISIRDTAETFGRLLGRKPIITGKENGLAYVSSAGRSHSMFGMPQVPLERVIQWTADWVRRGGRNLGKPTHFEVQDGKY
jgi:nucleoside-diphosphate-sugar epimerase